MNKREITHGHGAQSPSWPFGLLLFCSFVPFFIKAVEYIALQSYVPIIVFAALAFLVFNALRSNTAKGLRAVKRWAYLLFAWSLLRTGIMVLLYFFSIGEAHPLNQLNVSFVLITLLHVLLAVALLRKRTAVVQAFAVLRQ